jgi:vitamin B12 transporter
MTHFSRSLLRSTSILLALSSVAAVPAHAETVAASPADVTELIVTASRTEERRDASPVSSTILSASELDAGQAVNLAEALARVPGVYFDRNGGAGQNTQIRIRGGEAHDTVVLIDGVKVNDPSAPTGGYNFANLLAGDIDRVEILRGPQSTLWGSNAVGGVVNVISKLPSKDGEARLVGEVGSLNTLMVRGHFGIGGDWGGLRVAAGDYRTDGVSAAGPSTGAREADPFHQTNLSARLNVNLGETTQLDLRASGYRSRADIDGYAPPFYEFGDTSEFTKTEGSQGYAGISFRISGLSNRVGVSFARTKRDTLTDFPYGYVGVSNRLEYQGEVGVSDQLKLIFGAEKERSRIDDGFAKHRTALTSVYAQARYHPLDTLNLTAGVRLDDHDTYGKFQTAQLGAVYGLNDGETLVRANFSQGFRAPSLSELYGAYGANPSLDPEESNGWDFGVEHHLFQDSLVLSATWFERKTSNKIIYIPPNLNQGRSQARGLELLADWNPTEALSVSANYTWTDAVNASGVRLLRRPEHLANLDIDYDWTNGVKSGLSISYKGKRRDIDGNFATIDAKAYTLVDARISYPMTEKAEVYGRIENLTDQDYEPILTYGAAGRSAYVGIRLTF